MYRGCRWIAACVVVAILTLVSAGSASAAPGGDAVLASTTLTIGSGSQLAITPSCPAGSRALGGGAHPLPPTGAADASNVYRIGFNGPVDETGTTAATNDGDIPRGWSVQLHNDGGPRQFRVFTVCSANSDATLSEFTYTTNGNMPAESNEKSIACPAGSRAIGGGVGTTTPIPPTTTGGYPYSYRSVPVSSTGTVAGTATGDIPRAWLSNASLQSTTIGTTVLRFYAVCSASSDATVQVAPFTVTSPSEAVNAGVATCPTGSRALSGGVASDLAQSTAGGAAFRIRRSGPLDASSTADLPQGTDSGDVAQSWYGEQRIGGTATATFRTIAVCATSDVPVPPTTGPTACSRAQADLATARSEFFAAQSALDKAKKKFEKAKKGKSKKAKKKRKALKQKLKSAQKALKSADAAADAAGARVQQFC